MQFTIETFDHYELYATYEPTENAKGTLVFSHGFVEYSAHYTQLGPILNDLGYNLLKYDLRGHGRSSYPLGDCKNFQDFANDLNRCVQWAQQEAPLLPIFTMGFSLGGMITTVYGIMYPYETQGQILIGPNVTPQPQFNDIPAPISIQEFLNLLHTSGDAGIQKLLAMDSPYILKQATPSFLKECLVKAPTFIQDYRAHYTLPLFLLQGRHDPMVSVVGNLNFYETIASTDKTLTIEENEYHDLLRIPDAKRIITAIAEWCDRHL